jgi:hypothetical protein
MTKMAMEKNMENRKNYFNKFGYTLYRITEEYKDISPRNPKQRQEYIDSLKLFLEQSLHSEYESDLRHFEKLDTNENQEEVFEQTKLNIIEFIRTVEAKK